MCPSLSAAFGKMLTMQAGHDCPPRPYLGFCGSKGEMKMERKEGGAGGLKTSRLLGVCGSLLEQCLAPVRHFNKTWQHDLIAKTLALFNDQPMGLQRSDSHK